MTTSDRSAARAIAAAGLAAGILDIAAAILYSAALGGRPVRVLQYIASGLLGAEAFKGGAATAALGLALHLVIALGAAVVFYVASRRVDVLVRRPVLSGLLYGIVVWAVMNRVVVPLSAVARRPFSIEGAAIMIVIHMVCVGLPIALAVRRYAPPRPA
jgi:hypothetical protein